MNVLYNRRAHQSSMFAIETLLALSYHSVILWNASGNTTTNTKSYLSAAGTSLDAIYPYSDSESDSGSSATWPVIRWLLSRGAGNYLAINNNKNLIIKLTHSAPLITIMIAGRLATVFLLLYSSICIPLYHFCRGGRRAPLWEKTKIQFEFEPVNGKFWLGLGSFPSALKLRF